MAADTTTLTEKMRAALRISSTSEKITEEINDCIAACKADMKNDGVKVIFISRIQHSAASVRNGHQQHRKWGVKRWSGWTN